MIGAVLQIAKEGFSFWRETKREKHNVKMAGLKNRQRLLQDEQTNNHEWEMKSLETSSRFLKWFSFMLFAGPIVVTVFNPDRGGEIWQNLQIVPPDFMKIYYGITGSIWGLASLKDAGVSFKSLLRVISKE